MPNVLKTVFLLFLCSPLNAQAFPSVLSSWQDRYPDSQSDENAAGSGQPCTLCHNSSNFTQRNPYAYSLAQNSFDFSAVEGLDADGDGTTNLEEINAGTQPGWTPGENNNLFDFAGQVASNVFPPEGILGGLDPPIAMQPIAIPSLGGRAPLILSLLLLLLIWRHHGYRHR